MEKAPESVATCASCSGPLEGAPRPAPSLALPRLFSHHHPTRCHPTGRLPSCIHPTHTHPWPTPRGIGTSAKLGMVSKNNLVEKTSWSQARGAPLNMYPAGPTDRGAPTGFLSLACVGRGDGRGRRWQEGASTACTCAPCGYAVPVGSPSVTGRVVSCANAMSSRQTCSRFAEATPRPVHVRLASSTNVRCGNTNT